MSQANTVAAKTFGWTLVVLAALSLVVVGLGGTTLQLLAAGVGSVVLVLTYARLGPQYAFAVGQVTAIAILGDEFQILPLALVEGTLLGVLLIADLQSQYYRASVGIAVLLTGVLVAVGIGTAHVWGNLWISGLSLVGIGGLIAYVLYRFEQVQLGVITDE